MPQHQYEIEIKSLLGEKKNVDSLKKKMKESDSAYKQTSTSKQLNHYFVGGDHAKLYKIVSPYVPEDSHERFLHILEDGKDLSIRTRQQDDTILFVIKASIDDTTSSNGTARIEYEVETPQLTLDELDQKLLDADCEYQAKWSREREEYSYKNATVCIDKNAGYGYLAEFERVIESESDALEEKELLRALMNELDVEELPQDRLERMFEHYNAHWPEYYGTDKIFVIH